MSDAQAIWTVIEKAITEESDGHESWKMAHQSIFQLERERDELRADVSEIIHDETGENSCEVVFIKSRFDELHGQIDDMRAEVERLKADKARLDWIEKHVTSLPMLSEAWGEFPGTFRDVLDGAMNPNPDQQSA